ncbi:hypothetical protein [Clostridium grantii]|uniref:Uncharacterized protein n=1 Tax=Clostridium grantii DSM 8605 TaxID=1121316 RepID=A0A1M5WPZ6_9CLOT|nr:hypothetical protein [Clostridium grantii]SHH89568.1 hypothetical protein SAMN02745207_03042 [Clostridium grantii DSM 8605]
MSKIIEAVIWFVSYLGFLFVSLMMSEYLPLLIPGGDDNLRPIYIGAGLIFATLIICTRLILREIKNINKGSDYDED